MTSRSIYLPRLVESSINLAMMTNGCVVVEGPKWCGKSTTLNLFANSTIKLQTQAVYNQYKTLANLGDPQLLSGDKPMLFDEWQKIPELWDYIRSYIDDTNGRGLFLLTGSSKPIEDNTRHSGIGRFKKIMMRTMSLWESQESSGEVSLKQLFDKTGSIAGKNKYQLSDIAYLICRGGFPSAVTEQSKEYSLNYAKDYVDSLIQSDITQVDDIRRNPNRARVILKSYARNVATSATITTILKDTQANFEIKDQRTIFSYINAFVKLFVIDETESWTPRLRSKTAIRTTKTRYFVDPSIATSILHASPKDLINDLQTFGLLFKNLVVRDLKVYSEILGGKVFKYGDKNGLEADAVIHLDDGRWGLIEIKLGGEELINEGAKNLLKLSEIIDQEVMNAPSFMAIITATDALAYQRADGVYVIPIGCLKP